MDIPPNDPGTLPKKLHPDDQKTIYDAILIDDAGHESPPTASDNPSLAQSNSPMSHQPPSQPQPSSVSWVERLLSPQSLQMMMSAGGGVLVIGLVIWLWSIGLFENPLVAAISMAFGNLAVLAGGIFLCTQTRYRLAGRGLTLLSVMTLPLHLWFYDAQGLISLDHGGHLWIPALFICGILAATARATRDSLFAYPLVGGVVLTGLLFLANPAIGSLWLALPLSMFLVVTGGIAIHAINAFSEKEGAFSRQQFGTAFFNAGHMVLISGLAVLCTRHLSHLLNFSELAQGSLVWSLGVLAVAVYCYVFSHINEKRYGSFFLVLASAVGLWMGVTVLDLLAIELTLNLGICLIALAILAWNFWGHRFGKQGSGAEELENDWLYVGLPILGVMMAILGIGQSLLAIGAGSTWWDLTFCAQLILSVLALVSFPGVWRKSEGNPMAAKNAGRMISLITGSICLGIFPVVIAAKAFHLSALFALGAVLLIPVLFLAVAFSNSLRIDPTRLRIAAFVSTSATLLTTLVPFQLGTMEFAAWPTMGLFVAIAGIYFFVAQTSSNGGESNRDEYLRMLGNVGGTFAFLVAMVQAAVILEVNSAYVILNALAAIGIVVVGISKTLQMVRLEKAAKEVANSEGSKSSTEAGLLTLGNVFLIAASIGSISFVGTQLLNGSAGFSEVGLLCIQLIVAGLAWLANSSVAWRQSYLVTCMAMTSLAAVVSISKIEMNPVQMMEVVAVMVGLLSIVSSYIGWSREKDQSNDMVTMGFAIGAVLMALPMIMGIIGYRMADAGSVDHVWRQIHEIGALVIGLGLLTSGVLSKVRSTTIAGAMVMAAYIGSILLLIRWPEQLQSVSFLLMLGGGFVFGSGILLSLYRDRLLALPGKIRDGAGVFSFMKWR